MWRNSLGQYSVGEIFIPAWYSTKQHEFKPLVIRRIDCETKTTKTTESVCGTGQDAKGWVTPQDQQTTTPAT